jgi:hypothetical protein
MIDVTNLNQAWHHWRASRVQAHRPCLSVLHNEVDCSHLPEAERCENCR